MLLVFSFAGTPEGVGPVRVGQKIKAGITGLIDVEFDVQRRKREFSTWCDKQKASGKHHICGSISVMLLYLTVPYTIIQDTKADKNIVSYVSGAEQQL